MNFASGHRLGPYEIVAPLGATVMSVAVEASDTFRPGAPRPLFALNPGVTGIEASSDGRSFLVSTPAEPVRRDIRLVVNWPGLVGR